MSADEPTVEVSGPHVTIEVVDERTARLAADYVQDVSLSYQPSASEHLSEATDRPEDDFEPDAAIPDFEEQTVETTDTNSDDEDEGEDEPDSQDTPIDGQPWAEYDDRDDRVEAFIAAMYDHYDEPFETRASDVAEQVDESSVGVSYSLKALDAFTAEKVDTDAGGTAIWEIRPDNTDATEPDDETDDTEAAADAPSRDHSPTITVDTKTGTRTLDANDVVDAIADAPGKHRAKAPLNLDTVGFEALMDKLDLTAIFKKEAPLATDYVRDTVEGYLEERDA